MPRRSIRRQQEGLHLADIAEVFLGQLEMMEVHFRPSHHLLRALLRGREDDFACFAIVALAGAVAVQFIDGHGLAVGVVSLSFRCFRLARRHLPDEIPRRVGGAQKGGQEYGC